MYMEKISGFNDPLKVDGLSPYLTGYKISTNLPNYIHDHFQPGHRKVIVSTDDYFKKTVKPLDFWSFIPKNHSNLEPKKSLQLRTNQLAAPQPRGAEFSAYDAEGVPTHDKDGNALPKSAIKKLAKDLGVSGMNQSP